MKKWWIGILAVMMCVTACGCSREGGRMAEDAGTTDKIPVMIHEDEFIVYENVYVQHAESLYVGEKQTKEGVFCSLYDMDAGITRYFVWGCSNETLSQDWQWELKIKDPTDLPPVGSLIQVTGVFEANEEAMSGYWLKRPSWIVKTVYTGPVYDVNMACMSATLASEQIHQWQHHGADAWEGKTVALYGRVLSSDQIQHPYAEAAWTQQVQGEEPLPEMGTVVLVSGILGSGVVIHETVTETELYG